MSDFTHIERKMNIFDEDEELKKDAWGGSDLIGGSPRSVGSCLTPDEVFDIVVKSYV